jgi:hypothetical protein
MFELGRIRKISVLILIGVLLGAGIIPIINGNQIRISDSKSAIFGLNTATKVVQAKLHELDKTDFSIVESTQIINEQGKTLFYIYNLSPQGYIVVSGSYNLPPVIAYSFTSNFFTFNDANPLYSMLFSDITLRLENIQKLPEKIIQERHFQWDSYRLERPIASSGFEQWPPEGTTSTGGWLETSWTQGEPYNNFCPLDKTNGGRSVAGCPSITMAMILDYYKTTNNIVFNDSDDYHHIYGGNNYWIDNDYISYDFPSFPTLNGYLVTLNSHYQNQTPTTDTDIAALIFACGVAANQVYGSDGSGTFSVNQAFAAYKRFYCTTCTLLRDNDSNVYGRLAKNMINAMPAHLAVVDESWTTGHNLVVDGYNTDDFFHLNFGWGGAYNGWYLLPDDLPYGLTVLEGVIIDIMYDHVGPQVRCDGSIHLSNITSGATISESFTVENVGTSGSLLNWAITSYPDWGTWTFTPSSGTSLTPEQEPVTINVSIVAPEKKNREYSGYLKVTNTDNPTDCYIVQITLATPYKPDLYFLDILQTLMERFPNAFPVLRLLLNH